MLGGDPHEYSESSREMLLNTGIYFGVTMICYGLTTALRHFKCRVHGLGLLFVEPSLIQGCCGLWLSFHRGRRKRRDETAFISETLCGLIWGGMRRGLVQK